MRNLVALLIALVAVSLAACSNEAPPEGAAVTHRERLPVMVTYGCSKLISDSGITRYKIITEEWKVYDQTDPPRQDFLKGILLLRFDNQMNVDMHITADTAYWYNSNLWELRGRVFVSNEADQTTYRSEQLFWDMGDHEFYSDAWMRITTPDRTVSGNHFRSNEGMTVYEVLKSDGSLPMPKDNKNSADTTKVKTTPVKVAP